MNRLVSAHSAVLKSAPGYGCAFLCLSPSLTAPYCYDGCELISRSFIHRWGVAKPRSAEANVADGTPISRSFVHSSLGSSQVVRHLPLEQAFGGSSPSSPATSDLSDVAGQ